MFFNINKIYVKYEFYNKKKCKQTQVEVLKFKKGSIKTYSDILW